MKAIAGFILGLAAIAGVGQEGPLPTTPGATISPARVVPAGGAPGMHFKLVSDTAGARVFAVIFSKGDDVLGGLTDFAIRNHITDAHFTAIGAVSGATLGWYDLGKKLYRAIPVAEQVEVLSMVGDVALYAGRPVVHAHMVLGRQDGSTVGGHVWQAVVNPTLEVFVTTHPTPLSKTPDDASGLKLIDPVQ